MKKRNYKHLMHKLTNFLTMFVTMFTMMICVYTCISMFVFEGYNFRIDYLFILLGISAVLSICLTLLFRINKIQLLSQIVIVYLLLVVMIYVMGFMFKLFSLKQWNYLLISAFVTISGLILLSGIILWKRRKESRSLNENLKEFKERDHK